MGKLLPQALKQLSLVLLLSAAPVTPASPLHPAGGGRLGFGGAVVL